MNLTKDRFVSTAARRGCRQLFCRCARSATDPVKWSLLLLVLISGCATLKQHQFPGDADWPRPYLMFFPGGPGAIPDDINRFKAMRDGGFRGDIEVFEWTDSRYKWGAALYAYHRNRMLATAAAQQITQIYRADPARPIHIWGVSAGAMMGIWMLEDLPPDVKIDVAILTAPMVSRDYNLSNALRHVKGKCYAFTNRADYLISGAATFVLGTMDRKHQVCAGEIGFFAPPGSDPEEYKKLVPMPYQWQWIQYSNYGLHMGCSAFPFVEMVIVPLLKAY